MATNQDGVIYVPSGCLAAVASYTFDIQPKSNIYHKLQISILMGGGDLLYSRGPQAEQRVYGRQTSSTVVGGYPHRILQDANRA
jgi:hypothetical protein